MRCRARRGLKVGKWAPAAVAGNSAKSSAVRRDSRTVGWGLMGCGEVGDWVRQEGEGGKGGGGARSCGLTSCRDAIGAWAAAPASGRDLAARAAALADALAAGAAALASSRDAVAAWPAAPASGRDLTARTAALADALAAGAAALA